MTNTDNPMPKEDRQDHILQFYGETGLDLPASVVHHNLSHTTWTRETTRRHVRELADLGYLEHVPDTKGFYRITDAGQQRIESNDSN